MDRSEERSAAAEDEPFANQKTGVFSTTHWSVVLGARQGDLASASAALERLCRTYWYPIYAFARRRGSDPHEAEDLTQAFFAFLLEKDTLKKVDRQKGKFRTFLLGFDELPGERVGQSADFETRRPTPDYFPRRNRRRGSLSPRNY